MTPSEIRQIAYFYDHAIADKEDRAFMHRLGFKEVTYELVDPEGETLARIYNEYAPDSLDEEWGHVKRMVQTLKDIEYMQIKFQLYDGEEAFDTEVIIP